MYLHLCDVRAGRFVAVGLVLLLLVVSCKQQDVPKETPVALEPVGFCRGTNMLLPLLVAEKQGFFSEQGLAVSVREFTMGRDALESMLRGECELATAAEPPVVEYALKRDDLRILGSVQSSDNMIRLVARVDRGIATPFDLRDKRIATVKGTNAHYFLELFLEKNRLPLNDVAIIFMKSDELLGALTSGQIDAIAMTDKVVAQAQESLQDKAVLMEAPGLYRSAIMLLTTTAFFEKRPGVAVKFLRAIDQAENFIQQRPDEALAIVQANQKVSSAEIKQQMGFSQYRLALDHALLMGLEDTARWTLQQAGDSQRPVPNFLNLIAAEPLRTVNPEGVRLEK
ncbi:MAG: NrtA/SsuA/CpmA family ABC transporter substrate-binding protein [Desulfurivibrionaceae bacterium]